MQPCHEWHHPLLHECVFHNLLGLGLQDVYKTQEQIKAAGGKITKEAGPLPGLGAPPYLHSLSRHERSRCPKKMRNNQILVPRCKFD